MRRCTEEFVMLFWDDKGNPIGFLHENGKREIYAVKRASKPDLQTIFESEYVPPGPHAQTRYQEPQEAIPGLRKP